MATELDHCASTHVEQTVATNGQSGTEQPRLSDEEYATEDNVVMAGVCGILSQSVIVMYSVRRVCSHKLQFAN